MMFRNPVVSVGTLGTETAVRNMKGKFQKGFYAVLLFIEEVF